MERFISLAALVANVSEARCPSTVPAVRPVTSVKVTVRPAPSADMARAFLTALRTAGKRANDKGVMVPGGRDATIADEAELIGAFCGYSKGQPHGTQLDNARQAAQRALRPVASSTAPYSRCSASVGGYVAGVNDAAAAQAKQQATLEGLLRAKIDEASEALRAGDEAALDRCEAEARNIRARIV